MEILKYIKASSPKPTRPWDFRVRQWIDCFKIPPPSLYTPLCLLQEVEKWYRQMEHPSDEKLVFIFECWCKHQEKPKLGHPLAAVRPDRPRPDQWKWI